jgi:type II secretory pathway component PulF
VKFTLASRAQLYHEFANYTRSSFGIGKACEAILERKRGRLPKPHRAFCESILRGVENGKSIAASLDDCPASISDLEKSILDAGERGGLLERAFHHLADHFERIADARRRILRSLVYPIVLFHVGAVFGIGGTALMTMVRPDAQVADAWSTARVGVMIFIGVYLLLIALGFALAALWRRAATSPAADRLVRRIPLLGAVHRDFALGRFSEVFAIHLTAGQKMDTGLRASGKAAHAGLLLAASQRGAQRLAGGDSLTNVLTDERSAFPDPFVSGVASAEESGRLDEELSHWARTYSEKSSESLETLARWAPKIFYYLILVVVALLILKVAHTYLAGIQGWLDVM